jgi:hypothetical protein
MESTEQADSEPAHNGSTTTATAPPPSATAQYGGYVSKWANETDEHKYARHTRNAAVFIAWLLGISAAVGIILGVLAVVDLGRTAQGINNVLPSPSPTCYDSNDPSTIGLPYC